MTSEPVRRMLLRMGMGMGMGRAEVSGAGLVLLLALSLTGCSEASPPESDGGVESTAQEWKGTPILAEDGEPLLRCGGPAFPVSAMSGGVDGLADHEEVASALERLVIQDGIYAPTALQGKDIEDAEWFVLGKSDGDGWEFSGSSDPCTLTPVLPSHLIWVEVTARPDALSPSSTSVPVQVSEYACTGGRDPDPYLQDPYILEGERAVTVYWTSETPEGGNTCQGNLGSDQVLELREPLGDRLLLDGSHWPPRIATQPPRY